MVAPHCAIGDIVPVTLEVSYCSQRSLRVSGNCATILVIIRACSHRCRLFGPAFRGCCWCGFVPTNIPDSGLFPWMFGSGSKEVFGMGLLFLVVTPSYLYVPVEVGDTVCSCRGCWLGSISSISLAWFCSCRGPWLGPSCRGLWLGSAPSAVTTSYLLLWRSLTQACSFCPGWLRHAPSKFAGSDLFPQMCLAQACSDKDLWLGPALVEFAQFIFFLIWMKLMIFFLYA